MNLVFIILLVGTEPSLDSLAYYLISTNSGVTEPVPDIKEWTDLKRALLTASIELELIDKREASYILSEYNNFNNDLNIIRLRYAVMKDAPKIDEHTNFCIAYQTIVDNLAFNRKYNSHIGFKSSMEFNNGWGAVKQENDQLYMIWDLLRDSKNNQYFITIRRSALLKLRSLLGDEDFRLGVMPPHVPIWRFAENW